MISSDEIALAVLRILFVQSLYVMLLFPLVLILVKGCRGRYPGAQHGLWLLILLRLVLPPDMAAPWSAGHLIRSLMPSLFSRPVSVFSHELIILTDQPKPIATAIPNVLSSL